MQKNNPYPGGILFAFLFCSLMVVIPALCAYYGMTNLSKFGDACDRDRETVIAIAAAERLFFDARLAVAQREKTGDIEYFEKFEALVVEIRATLENAEQILLEANIIDRIAKIQKTIQEYANIQQEREQVYKHVLDFLPKQIDSKNRIDKLFEECRLIAGELSRMNVKTIEDSEYVPRGNLEYLELLRRLEDDFRRLVPLPYQEMITLDSGRKRNVLDEFHKKKDDFIKEFNPIRTRVTTEREKSFLDELMHTFMIWVSQADGCYAEAMQLDSLQDISDKISAETEMLFDESRDYAANSFHHSSATRIASERLTTQLIVLSCLACLAVYFTVVFVAVHKFSAGKPDVAFDPYASDDTGGDRRNLDAVAAKLQEVVELLKR